MKTVWKFALSPDLQPTEVQIPMTAKILTCQVQGGTPCLWALVDPEMPFEIRKFIIVGTGWDIDAAVLPGWDRARQGDIEVMDYIGTFQAHDGVFIFHVFEILVTRKIKSVPH